MIRRPKVCDQASPPARTTTGQRIGLAILLAVHVGLLVWSDAVHSPSVDEAAHLPAGLSHLETGKIELYAVNPPLVRLIAALPVLAMSPTYDWSRSHVNAYERSEVAVAKDFIAANGYDAMRMFTVARIAMIPLYVLGPVICFHWARALYGPWSGLIAAALWCFSPMMLGHGSMVTPDVGAAVTGAASLFLLRRFRHRISWRHAIVFGLVTGLALATKTTWLAILPCVVVVMMTLYTWDSGGRLRQFVCVAVAGFVALLVLNSIYGFVGTLTRLGEYQFSSRALTTPHEDYTPYRLNRFRDSFLRDVPVPLPRRFCEGVDLQKRDFERGYRSYLMGEWKHGGWWYYYLVGLLVKTPIPFLLLLCISLGHGIRNWRLWKRDSALECCLLLLPAVLILALVSSQTGFNHHLRYVLPAFPFLFIVASRVAALGRPWRWMTCGLLSWQVGAVLFVAPHWVSYFNEAAGGPANGHVWLLDSNIDWGQDLLMLKWWQDEHPEASPLHLAAFTFFDPSDLGLQFQLPPPFQKQRPDVVDKHGRRGPQAGWHAISVTQLKGHHFSVWDGHGRRQWSDGCYRYFERFQPVDMIGYSIHVFHITDAEAERVRADLQAGETPVRRAHPPDS